MVGVSFQSLIASVSSSEQTVTWNSADKASNVVLSNGDLDMTCNTASFGAVRATLSRTSGKYYFEIYVVAVNGSSRAGIADGGASMTTYIGNSAKGIGCNGLAVLNITGAGWSEVGADGSATETVGDTDMFAVDITNGLFWLGKNGTWRDSGNPSAGTNQSATISAGATIYPAASSYSPGSTYRIVTKTASFAYSPPSGFSAWAAA